MTLIRNLFENQLIPEWKINYTYDDNGNLIQFVDYHWDKSQWIADGRNDLTFDNTYSRSELILPEIIYEVEVLVFNHMLINLEYNNWNETLNDWAKINNYSMYYSEQNITEISEIEVSKIKVYPNPVSEYLCFSIPGNDNQISFELFDIPGRKIMTKEIRGNENVSMNGVDKGMYFYSFIINGKEQNGKLIKE